MKSILFLVSVMFAFNSFGNGFNNEDIERIVREKFNSLASSCMMENEPAVIDNTSPRNGGMYRTETSVDMGFAKAVIVHGVDGDGDVMINGNRVVSADFYCEGTDGVRYTLDSNDQWIVE